MQREKQEEQNSQCENAHAQGECAGRREFLVRAIGMTSGLALGLTALTASGQADDNSAPEAASKAAEQVVKIGEHAKLQEIGGFDTIEVGGDKIVVAHTAADTFVACSAVCPHRGGPIYYDKDTQQFFCPLHNSRFALDGKVVRGPAKSDLKSYPSQTAAVVTLKTGA
ncbi:MAG TPA: Rieske (2Fe-2S) protein [Abditibacteriaceae bacterium]